MKKVLIFSLAYLPHIGGAEVAIKEITDRIGDIEFHLITNRFDSTLPKEEKIGNVHVHRIGIATKKPTMTDLRKWPLHLNKFLFQFLAAWHAHKLHRVHTYDGIWAMMAHSAGVPAVLFKLFNKRVKYILNLQEGDPPEYIERTMRPLWPLFVLAFRKADVIQPLSNFLAGWARRMGYKGRIEIIPNGVDSAHFSKRYTTEEITELQDDLGKKMGDIFLITTSRLVRKNAVDDVIRALALLPENIMFLVLGSGPEKESLVALAEEEGVSERVRFLGHVGHEDMPKYLKASDIFIRPSRSEGFGSSFMEAMAASIPVIATQEGGIADFLYDESRNPDMPVTGWAVDKDSPEDIARAIRDIMSHREKMGAVVRTARALVSEKYDWNVIARTMREKVFSIL